jgi:hypothetical protein
VRVRLGRAPSGDTGEVPEGAGRWARVKSGFIFLILLSFTLCGLLSPLVDTPVVGNGCARAVSDSATETGAVRELPEMGGLHHHYERMTA